MIVVGETSILRYPGDRTMRYLLLCLVLCLVGCQGPQIRRVGLTIEHPSIEGKYQIDVEL